MNIEKHSVHIAGEVPEDVDFEQFYEPKELKRMDRYITLGMIAADLAFDYKSNLVEVAFEKLHVDYQNSILKTEDIVRIVFVGGPTRLCARYRRAGRGSH